MYMKKRSNRQSRQELCQSVDWMLLVVEGFARVAELVDALVLGTSALCMGVRVPPLAPFGVCY